MKREIVLRNLHMGCGEGLVGRVRPAPVSGNREPVVRQTKTAQRHVGKDKR